MYAIPVDELSIARIENFRSQAKQAALARAMKLGFVSEMNQLVFHEAFPHTDLGQQVGAGYTNEAYLTGAAVINTWTSVFDTGVVPALGNRQIAVFYKIADWTVAPACTAVRFRLGPTGATTLGWVHIEQFINVKLTPEVYLSEPVVYGPTDALFIEFYPNAAVGAGGEQLGFGCYIAEPTGRSIS
jgi:hypothetical protein